MKAQIALITGNHLARNPRALKEASALAAEGYAVEVLGATFDSTLEEEDRHLASQGGFTFTSVFSVASSAPAWTRFRVRGRRWVAYRALRIGVEIPGSLGYGAENLLSAARDRQANLFIAHSEPALYAANRLAHEGRRVGVDMEDWFSEDTPARDLGPKRLLRSLERETLRAAAYSSTTSAALSEAISREFGCKPATIVYNAFPWADRARIDGRALDRRHRSLPSLHWYSQTLGPGRGLEVLIAALPALKPLEIHLRGRADESFRQWCVEHAPLEWRSRIHFHPLVSNAELLSRIAEHDIGFAGEMPSTRSRNLTVTNKILHYLLAGLAVVASDTAGQREIASECGAVRLFRSGDPRSLAEGINVLLDSPEELERARLCALSCAMKRFSWEHQADRLVKAVEAGLSSMKV